MNSDATQSRQRNSRTVLLVQEQPLLWEMAFFRVQQGYGLTPQEKGQEAVSKWAVVATTGFAAKGTVTFLNLPHCSLFICTSELLFTKVSELLNVQRLHCHSRNVLTGRSFCEPAGSSLPPGCDHHCWDAWAVQSTRRHTNPGEAVSCTSCAATPSRDSHNVFWVTPPYSLNSSKEVIDVAGFSWAGLKLPSNAFRWGKKH